MPIAVERVLGCARFRNGSTENRSTFQPTPISMRRGILSYLSRNYRKTPRLTPVPPAREACLSGAEVVGQIQRRVGRLLHAAGGHEELRKFIEGEFLPHFAQATLRARWGYQEQGLDFRLELRRDLQILSPSDFGFHNSVRRPDGTLVFVDFELFRARRPGQIGSRFSVASGNDA